MITLFPVEMMNRETRRGIKRIESLSTEESVTKENI